MTLPYDIGKFDRCTIGAKAYRFIKHDAVAGDYYFAAEGADDYVEIIDQDRLSRLMASPDWRHDPGYYDPENRRGGRNAETRLALAPPRHRYQAVFNHYVMGFLHLEIQHGTATLSDASLSSFRFRLQRRLAENPTELRHKLGRMRAGDQYSVPTVPSVSTLRKHYRIYRQSCGDVLAHKPKLPRVLKMRRSACPEGLEVIYNLIREALTPETRGKSAPASDVVYKLRQVNEKRQAEGLRPFYVYGERQVQRMIASLSPFERACAQEGIDKARYKFSSYLSGVSPICLLERVEIDDWHVDLITWFRFLGLLELLPDEIIEMLPVGRRWVCVAIDAASRCILGLRIAAEPSAEEFRKLLEMVVSDKTELARACGAKGTWHHCGRPITIATDTGSSFIATESSERTTDLLAAIEYALVMCAELRAVIERYFGTMARTLTPRLKGHTQSNPAKRGDYDAEANACLDDDDLLRILVCYVVDEYHRRPHEGLGGQMPISKWNDLEKEAGFLQPPVDRLTRCAALGVDLDVRLGKQGVTVFSNRYSCPELRQHYATGADRNMRVRVDTSNLGMVAVEVGGKWVPAFPHTKDVEGISLPEWEEQCRALRTRFKREAELSAEYRAHAAKMIRDINANAQARLRRLQATPFGHSAEYVQHLQATLFSGFRFRDETTPSFSDAPDGLGREILPAPDRGMEDASDSTSPTVIPDDDDRWEGWLDESNDAWRLEDGQ